MAIYLFDGCFANFQQNGKLQEASQDLRFIAQRRLIQRRYPLWPGSIYFNLLRINVKFIHKAIIPHLFFSLDFFPEILGSLLNGLDRSDRLFGDLLPLLKISFLIFTYIIIRVFRKVSPFIKVILCYN